MLQIVSGKFFKHEKCYETLHRGTYFTNYRMLDGAPIVTSIGRLLPSTGRGGLGTMTYELTEKIEWAQPTPGLLISTGGQELVQDFAAVAAFALNITCSTDPDLMLRLTTSHGMDIKSRQHPQRYLRRVFDTEVMAESGDAEALNSFLQNLIGLKRAAYDGVIRAIRRYVTATHRIADETHLAYALFVMSIEAIAQTADVPLATWDDYEEGKRQRIDKALRGTEADLKERIRSAVLQNEHIAISRRFREFSIQHIDPLFFREKAAGSTRPIRRPDLTVLLKRAYEIRSSYVHRLENVPQLLTMPFNHAETFEIGGQPTLTFEGIARLAKYVITQFVERAPKVDREEFNWHAALPNIVTMQLAPQYWIGRPESYSPKVANLWLQTFLSQVSAIQCGHAGAVLTDLSTVLDKIEGMALDSLSQKVRRPILALYHLFAILTAPNLRRTRHKALLDRYCADFAKPSLEELAIRLVTGENFPWQLEELEDLLTAYYRQLYRKQGFSLGNLFEAIFLLRLAEAYRGAGNESRTRELIASAVEAYPDHAGLYAYEKNLREGPLDAIDEYSVLLPRTNRRTAEDTISQQTESVLAIKQADPPDGLA